MGLFGLLGIFVFVSQVQAALPPSNVDESRYCETGSYHRLTGPSLESHDGRCYPLLRPELGFDADVLPAVGKVNTLTECSYEALNAAVQDMTEGLLVVNIPACELSLGSQQIYIRRDNLVIQGMGMDQTMINARGNSAFQVVFYMDQGQENVVIRDLGVEGNLQEVIGVDMNKGQNVLVERLWFRNGRIAARFPNTRQYTARYIDSYFNSFHGVSAKDCFEVNVPCTNRSGDYLVYSNSVGGGGYETGATGNGIDLHSEIGEVAGNYSYKNGQANKFPDARDIYVHDNVFEANTSTGRVIRVYSSVQNQVEDVYIFHNTFRDNQSEIVLKLDNSDANYWNGPVYAINNSYQGNDAAKINQIGSDVPVKFAVCAGTQDWERTPANMRVEVSGEVCQLGELPEPTTTPVERSWVNIIEWMSLFGDTNLRAVLVWW